MPVGKAKKSSPVTIGVVFHELTSGFYSLIMTGIDLEAFKLGYQLLITVSKPEVPGQCSAYDILEKAQVDGLIVLDSTMTPETLGRLKASGKPMAIIQNTFSDDELSAVVADNIGGAYKAMKHLLDQGYRKLLIVTGAPTVEDSDLRMRGCEKALAEYGMTINDVGVIVGDYKASEALHALRNFRERHGLPRAIFAFNDDMALAIMKEFRQRGIEVPEEVAIVGFDGIDAADLMGLTTVKVPMVEVGKEAVRLVAERIQNSDAPSRHVVKETALIIRESCGARA
jgi:DNA-binding LacI/PurR family transcriptional regulator